MANTAMSDSGATPGPTVVTDPSRPSAASESRSGVSAASSGVSPPNSGMGSSPSPSRHTYSKRFIRRRTIAEGLRASSSGAGGEPMWDADHGSDTDGRAVPGLGPLGPGLDRHARGAGALPRPCSGADLGGRPGAVPRRLPPG